MAFKLQYDSLDLATCLETLMFDKKVKGMYRDRLSVGSYELELFAKKPDDDYAKISMEMISRKNMRVHSVHVSVSHKSKSNQAEEDYYTVDITFLNKKDQLIADMSFAAYLVEQPYLQVRHKDGKVEYWYVTA